MYGQPSAFNNPAASMMGQNSAGSMFGQQPDMFGGSFGGFGMGAASAMGSMSFMGSMGQPTSGASYMQQQQAEAQKQKEAYDAQMKKQ